MLLYSPQEYICKVERKLYDNRYNCVPVGYRGPLFYASCSIPLTNNYFFLKPLPGGTEDR